MKLSDIKLITIDCTKSSDIKLMKLDFMNFLNQNSSKPFLYGLKEANGDEKIVSLKELGF